MSNEGIKKMLKSKILLYEKPNIFRLVSMRDLWDIYVPNPYGKFGIDIIR